MSKFFKALEQAERERALRGAGQRAKAPPTEGAGDTLPEAPPEAPVTSRKDAATGALRRVPSSSPPAPIVGTAPSGRARPRPATGSARPAANIPGDGVDEHLVSLLMPLAFEAEQYRALRHVIEHLHKNNDLKVIGITSPGGGDGKTTTAINLAGALAQASEARVLLVDADLRRPSVPDRLGLTDTEGPGLVDAILDSRFDLDRVVRSLPSFNLAVLAAGSEPSAHYEVLKSPRLGMLVEEARRRYDYVIMDTPPLVALPDCRLIEKLVDGLLLVVAANRTPRKLIEEALNVVDPAKLVGLVFNGDQRPLSGYRYNYSGYGYGRSSNGNRAGWMARALEKVGGRRQRRGVSD